MSAAPSCSPLLKRIDGAGLLVLGAVLIASGRALAYTGRRFRARALLSLGIASLVLKIVLRNRPAECVMAETKEASRPPNIGGASIGTLPCIGILP
ncbi:MAG: hypothetical protein BGO16_09475 [Nitrobacter sp. 62-23]|nr:MAG: hypothetical protein BGO16_09475 [Nitrobacter sp. 62-23]